MKKKNFENTADIGHFVFLLHYRGVYCSWRCLHYRGKLHLDVSALQRSVLLLKVSATGPKQHLDVSALQRSVLLLEVSTLQGPKLHLDVSALQRSALLLEVSATGPELHLDVSALHRNELLLEVSTLQGPELHLDVSALCTTEECTAPRCVYTIGA